MLQKINDEVLTPALRLLPASWDSKEARVMLLAIGLQESRFTHRYQVVQGKPGAKGPARGFFQFELGTEASRGGVTGVYMHPATKYWLRTVCAARDVLCYPTDIWQALENDDILAAAVARLLLVTDAYPLPKTNDMRGAWDLYAKRTWRPGKPHADTWGAFHAQARAVVMQEKPAPEPPPPPTFTKAPPSALPPQGAFSFWRWIASIFSKKV